MIFTKSVGIVLNDSTPPDPISAPGEEEELDWPTKGETKRPRKSDEELEDEELAERADRLAAEMAEETGGEALSVELGAGPAVGGVEKPV